jgi:hypothetical protein
LHPATVTVAVVFSYDPGEPECTKIITANAKQINASVIVTTLAFLALRGGVVGLGALGGIIGNSVAV